MTSLFGSPHAQGFQADTDDVMRDAIENLVGAAPGKMPSARQLGNRLRGLRRRVVDGRYLDTDAQVGRYGSRWRLFDTKKTAKETENAD